MKPCCSFRRLAASLCRGTGRSPQAPVLSPASMTPTRRSIFPPTISWPICNAKTGTWTGNVVVVQGDTRMRANSVRLNVTGKDNKPTRSLANGNVVVDSPTSGTVTGDNGVYDVVAAHRHHDRQCRADARQKDVMRGAQLTVNLDTGQATLGGGAKTPGRATARAAGCRASLPAELLNPPPNSN